MTGQKTRDRMYATGKHESIVVFPMLLVFWVQLLIERPY